jgi:hypothetical protein
MEIDAFAREIARYSLILADYPNKNSWRITRDDVFSSPTFASEVKDAKVVLCNPPYGEFPKTQREKYSDLSSTNKAAEAVVRILSHRPEMIGLLLPRSFVFRKAFRQARRMLLHSYGEISITALPDIAFRFSQVDTVAITAFGAPRERPQVHRAYVSAGDYQRFIQTGAPTWESRSEMTLAEGIPTLSLHPLEERLRAELSAHRSLAAVAEIHRGVEYRGPVGDHVSDSPEYDYLPGLQNVEDGLEPYFVRPAKYLDAKPANFRSSSHATRRWQAPKVIANAARTSRGAWRIAAAVDDQGLLYYQRFLVLWPTGDLSVEVIAAILNGPVANALLSLQLGLRDNLVETVGALPVPAFEAEALERLKALVTEYREVRQVWRETHPLSSAGVGKCAAITERIDELVIAGYGLSPDLLRDLRAYLMGTSRPGPRAMDEKDVRRRHGWLVDRNLVGELSSHERGEKARLETLLDQIDAPLYQPFLSGLDELRAAMSRGRTES